MSIFGKRKSPFSESAKILSEEGFTQNYVDKLEEEISVLKKGSEIAEGKSYLINGLIVNGQLDKAYRIYSECDESRLFEKLDRNLYPNLLHNVIFSLFVKNKFKAADKIYNEHNDVILSEHTSSMKRTLAIHEHINERYENAVTVFAKMLDCDCRFVDICIVKTLLRLDMFERAGELCKNFDTYECRNELGDEARKLRKRIFEGLSPKNKVKMIKKK